MSEETFWNYEPTPCRKVRVIIGASPVATWWCAGLEGTEREAVEVNYHGKRFYLDNEGGTIPGGGAWPAGEGWAKVTRGRGGPHWPHSEIPVAQVLPASVDGRPKAGDALAAPLATSAVPAKQGDAQPTPPKDSPHDQL